MNETILFTIDRFTNTFKLYAYHFVLEKNIKMALICNKKNADIYDDKWNIAITIIAIKTKQ